MFTNKWKVCKIKKAEYRKFKVINDKNNDIDALKEILSRRLKHSEWKLPNLIVIDGGQAQINIANKIFENIPIVSVVKNDAHKPDHILGDEKIINIHIKSILLANSEAHRFAISYHKRLRNNSFLE